MLHPCLYVYIQGQFLIMSGLAINLILILIMEPKISAFDKPLYKLLFSVDFHI